MRDQTPGPSENANHGLESEFRGRFCEGRGDLEFLRLIDDSFRFFHAGPHVPNLTMLYQPDWDTFAEGAGWGAWWIQNSYGFSYSVTPFLQAPWLDILQRSWDLHWDNQGDGKRMGLFAGDARLAALVAPDGCLGDAAKPREIVYKQGDGEVQIHDWFYEATAAGVVMQAEILLRTRDRAALGVYLPKMERACNFIEGVRDLGNNLFLVGPACNLLAPSYGGVRMQDGSFGKGYLAGLSITYTAALDRMLELFTLAGDNAKRELYQHRLDITRDSLKLLLTGKGYFVKSMEPDGTLHGVLGQARYAYLEGVANADAMALRGVVDDRTAERIYDQIAAFSEIRPFDFLLTNAPGLDDTYWNWGHAEPLGGFQRFGDWVNGGVWGTVEGRAILGYYRLNRFDDVRRSALRAMKWAKDYRMDAPWSQRGENTHNAWSDGGNNQVGGVAVMVDNFAIPAATIRGLFEYVYRADRLLLYPHIPPAITEYVQKEPVWFGDKAIYLTCRNGGGRIASVMINGERKTVPAADHMALLYAELPAQARVEIVMEGALQSASVSVSSPPKATHPVANTELPESLKQPHAVLTEMNMRLVEVPGAVAERAFVAEALDAIEAWRERCLLDPGPGHFRPITPERREGILKFHEQTALGMYRGVVTRMQRYADSFVRPR